MKEQDLLRLARELYDEGYSADCDNIDRAEDDLNFMVGDQWPDNVRQAREEQGRPCLTINRMPQFLRQVTGDIRRNEPSIKVLPVDSGADPEIASIYEGLIRQIEHHSNADMHYEQAASSAAACGMGALRVYSEYSDDDTFEQDLKIAHISNPFAVMWDPLAEDPTRCDAKWCFVTSMMSKADFEKKYPGKTSSSFDGHINDSTYDNWYRNDDIMVAEFWRVESKARTIAMSPDGAVYDVTSVPKSEIDQNWTTRKVDGKEVACYKISGSEILEKRKVWPGSFIPVVAVMGEEINLGQTRYRSGVIRHAKDSQRRYNYWVSTQTELIALQPKTPYLVTPKMVESHEAQWAAANVSNFPFLKFNPDPQFPGGPNRLPPPLSSAAMTQELALAADEMKATTGVYDAALGAQSNETSGVAIRQRQAEGDISTSIYADNLVRAVRQLGRILVRAIPTIYDTTRVLRLRGVDGEESQVQINMPIMTQDGPNYLNDLSVGKYDIRIASGPSFTTQRQESAAALVELARSVPAIATAAPDLLAKAMDFPNADELAERLKMTIPPELRGNDEPSPQAMAAQQQQQAAAAMQEKMMAIDAAKAEAEAMEAKADADKAAIEVQEAQIELMIKSGAFENAVQQAVQQVLYGMPLEYPITR